MFSNKTNTREKEHVIVVTGNIHSTAEEYCNHRNRLITSFNKLNLKDTDITEKYLTRVFFGVYNNTTDRFCYYRCLASNDSALFLHLFFQKVMQMKISNGAKVAQVASGGINLSMWCDIMRHDGFNNQYKLFRRAYWGENNRNYCKSTTLTSHHVPIDTFGQQHGKKVINILFDHQHLAILKEVEVSKGCDPEYICNKNVDVYFEQS